MDTLLGAAALLLLLLFRTATLKPAEGWQLGPAFSAVPMYWCAQQLVEWRHWNASFPATATVDLHLRGTAALTLLLRSVILPRRISASPEFARLCRG